MRIAVTGGNGDMGRSLIPYLIEQDHTVVSIDRALPSTHMAKVNFLTADTRDFGQFIASIRGCDALVHLAAIRAPGNYPDPVVYADNTVGSYNALSAASALGIKRVCLASSINAIGGAFSRAPRYDYFPVDESHSTYTEDPYSLSKWVLEQQADSFARRYEWMTIASLRFHWLLDSRETAVKYTANLGDVAVRHLWAYSLLNECNRAILLSITAEFSGHEVFYITAPQTATSESSPDLAHRYYPSTEVRGDFSGNDSFFNCSKAAHILGWTHKEN
ncbi:MAG TPA: NAD(P)-dependent oxidoreductase [Anaerolineales bacterium]|nr:NAD(P)-dependent oxidoreductase [Anaerolineales bacterium]